MRARRVYETQPDGVPRRPVGDVIREAIQDFRPSAHVERLTFMDLLAVKEATDARFLPERFRKLSLAEVNRRIEDLRRVIGE